MVLSDNSPVLQWNQPAILCSSVLYYNILLATVNDSSQASIVGTPNNTSFNLTTLDIIQAAEVYYVWVR